MWLCRLLSFEAGLGLQAAEWVGLGRGGDLLAAGFLSGGDGSGDDGGGGIGLRFAKPKPKRFEFEIGGGGGGGGVDFLAWAFLAGGVDFLAGFFRGGGNGGGDDGLWLAEA